MKFKRCIAIVAVLFLIATSLSTADILPIPAMENQVFSTTSHIEAVAPVVEDTSLIWQLGYRGITNNAHVRGGGSHASAHSVSFAAYFDTIRTNGGQISEVKSFLMDTHGQSAGRRNIETTKVLTYNSQNGSHLMGAESYILDIVGNWSANSDGVLCVFSTGGQKTVPAFCNKVTASSKLISVNTAQVGSIGGITGSRRSETVPAALVYGISVTPDANSASGYADGIVSTTFTVSIMEGRTDGNFTPDAPPFKTGTIFDLSHFDELAATLTHFDTTTITGGISIFVKEFNYESGITCPSC